MFSVFQGHAVRVVITPSVLIMSSKASSTGFGLCGLSAVEGLGASSPWLSPRPLRLEISQQRLLSLGRRGPFLLHDPVWLTRVCLLQLSGPGFFSLVFGTFYILPAFFLKYALFDTSLVNSTCFVTTSICLSVCLSIHLSVYLSIYPSVCLSIHPSIHAFICLSIYLSVHLSIHLSIYPSVRPSVCLSTNLDIFSSKCIYLHLF